MLFSTFHPLLKDQHLEDPKSDYQNAVKVGPCRIGEKALFLPDRSFILKDAIQSSYADEGSAHVTGCCAGSVPVPRVVIVTAEKKIPVLFNSAEEADRLVQLLKDRA